MLTTCCRVLGLTAAVTMFPGILDHATAAEFIQITKEAKVASNLPVIVTTSGIKGHINFNQKFSSISNMCWRFLFVDDLLDTGERVYVSFKDGAFGFSALAGTPSDVTSCGFISEPPVWLDGKEDFTIDMNTGSVNLSSVSVTITGYSP